jgi:hypothetical protein
LVLVLVTGCTAYWQKDITMAVRHIAGNYGISIPFDLEKATEKEVESFVKKVVKDIKETGGKL